MALASAVGWKPAFITHEIGPTENDYTLTIVLIAPASINKLLILIYLSSSALSFRENSASPQRIHHPPPTPRQSERAAHSPCNRWWWGGLGLGLIWGRCITASNCRLMYCNADAVRGGFTIEFLVFMVYMVYRRCLSFVESYTATSIQTAVVSQSSFWHFGVFMVYGWCGWFAPWCLFVYGVFIVTMVCAMEFMVCAMVLMVFIVYLRSI